MHYYFGPIEKLQVRALEHYGAGRPDGPRVGRPNEIATAVGAELGLDIDDHDAAIAAAQIAELL